MIEQVWGLAVAGYKRVALLVLLMTTVATVSTGVAIGVLYNTAFERERLHLIAIAHSQARIMEAAARFDCTYQHNYPGAPEAATLAKIRDAHLGSKGIYGPVEFILGRRAGDQIVFLLRHRHSDTEPPAPVPFDSPYAEPTRRALTGQSGSMVGLDYHGVPVLAAYEPVAALKLGVVAKMDLAEIRAPFLRAATLVIGLALVLIGGATVLFFRLSNPMVRHIRESERRYERIFNGLRFSRFWISSLIATP